MTKWLNNLKQMKRAINENPQGKFTERCWNSMGKSGCEYKYRISATESFGMKKSAAISLKNKGVQFKKID